MLKEGVLVAPLPNRLLTVPLVLAITSCTPLPTVPSTFFTSAVI